MNLTPGYVLKASFLLLAFLMSAAGPLALLIGACRPALAVPQPRPPAGEAPVIDPQDPKLIRHVSRVKAVSTKVLLAHQVRGEKVFADDVYIRGVDQVELIRLLVGVLINKEILTLQEGEEILRKARVDLFHVLQDSSHSPSTVSTQTR